MPGIPWEVITESVDLTRVHDRLKDNYLNGHSDFQPGTPLDLQDSIRHLMESSGHASYIRNMAFAISERMAFAYQLEGCLQEQEVIYRDKAEEGEAHSDLSRAGEKLHDFACQRLRELQLLTRWPLVQPAKSWEQLNELRANLEHCSPWDLLGEQGSQAVVLPTLPALVRRDLLGSMEILLALAGQMGREPPQPTSSTAPANRGGMPWALGLVTFLPALRTLQAPALSTLRTLFADLRPQQRHVGVDDRHHPWFKDVKLRSARALLKERSGPMCRSFLRFGAPQGVRPFLWEAALCLPPLRPQDLEEYSELCNAALTRQALLDVAICADVESISDSEHFFLFEELIRAVLLAFARDHQVPSRTSVEQRTGTRREGPSTSTMPSGASADKAQQSVPNGLLPVRGLAVLTAPLCYLYEHPAAVFRLLRSLYCRYWCKLHSLVPVSGQSPALPVLIKTYEQLLQELDPEVVAHVHGLGLPISALAVPWICSAFAGHLHMEEVLLLWDRVLGLDSLLPLPLMAVAIVCFRRQVILACQSSSEVFDVMADISQLQTMPLLQAVLFQG